MAKAEGVKRGREEGGREKREEREGRVLSWFLLKC